MVATLTFDDFVKNLSGLKGQYGQQKDAAGKTSIRGQGVQLRADALKQGFNLNDLETQSQSSFQSMYPGNDAPQNQNYVSQLHNEAKKSYDNYMAAGSKFSGDVQGETKTGGSLLTTGTPVTTTTGANNTDLNDQTQQYFRQLQSMMSDKTAYNPDTDPAYQAYQNMFQRDAKSASNRAMADLNRRGISGGSIAQNQLAQIEQGAVNKAQDLIPGLAQNFQTNKQTQINNLSDVWKNLMSADQNEKTFGLQEAGVTGNYVPQETQNIFEEILRSKQAYGSADAAGKQGYADRNKELYNTLASMGIDTSILDGKVKYEDAAKNIANYKNPTLNKKEFDYKKERDKKDYEYKMDKDKKEFDYKVASDEWDNGFKVSQESWKRYADQSRLNDADSTRNNEVEWKKHLKAIDLTEANGNKATNDYMATILNSGSREEALKAIYTHQADIVETGANVDKILAAINAQWPNTKTTGGADPIDVKDIVNKK